MAKSKVLAAMAHPDDIEFLCAGTARLLVDQGWELNCVTLSGGDMGSAGGTREATRTMRLGEAADAAGVLGGTYSWAGLNDLAIHYCPDQLVQVTEVLRRFGPDLVITHSPDCYMPDHEETAKLVRAACFVAGIPLFPGPTGATGKGVPALYYADSFEGKDHFGQPVLADFWIDVTSTFEIRQRALACHTSQREWLRSHHRTDDYLETNERFARLQGERCGARYAEGFRQHLGHGYPQTNVLGETLAAYMKHRPDAQHRSAHGTPAQ